MNRAMRRAMERDGFAPVIVDTHCVDCGAPYCPRCDEHTTPCPECGGYHCEGCGWQAFAVGPREVESSCD